MKPFLLYCINSTIFKKATSSEVQILLKSLFEILKIKKEIVKGNNTIKMNGVHLLIVKSNPIRISKIYK